MTDSNASLEAEAARWAKELGKGATRLVLLAILDKGESYGYEILGRLQQRGVRTIATTEAGIYPVLKDLESKGALKANWRTTADGVPSRKYYRITANGTRLLELLRQEWKEYLKEVKSLTEA